MTGTAKAPEIRSTSSDIGLPDGMSRDDAYVQGLADGEELAKKNRVSEAQAMAAARNVTSSLRERHELLMAATGSHILKPHVESAAFEILERWGNQE